MKDPKSHSFETGTFVYMSSHVHNSNKTKYSLVHRRDLLDSFYNVSGLVKSVKISINPTLWTTGRFFSFFLKITHITLKGCKMTQNHCIQQLPVENVITRWERTSAIFKGFLVIHLDFLYTEYTECRKVIGYKNAFF